MWTRLISINVLVSGIILLASCRPSYEVGLNEYQYGDFDYEMFLEGDWERDSLQGVFTVEGKHHEEIVTNFNFEPESMYLFYFLNEQLAKVPYGESIALSRDKKVRFMVQYVPRFEEVLPCTLSFNLNQKKVCIRVQPTNFYIGDEDLNTNVPIEISKSRCHKTCMLSFSFKSYESAYVYDSSGKMVLKRVFEGSYDAIDVSTLQYGKYTLQLNGQYRPNFVTLQIIE